MTSKSILLESLLEPKKMTRSEYVDLLKDLSMGKFTIKSNKKIEYYDIPVSFDIEVSSFYDGENKVGIMYIWQLGIYGYVLFGRTWQEFEWAIEQMESILETSVDKRVMIYVHNLSYEFQFIRNRFEWEKVFALEERKPIQALTITGIEFRCSYKLSGYGLDKLPNQLVKYKNTKKTGQLDYNKVRHSWTPLSDEELEYCMYDVVVVNSYIQELIEKEGNITNIPLTKTGFVRRYCRHACYYDKGSRYSTKYHKYRDFISALTLTPEVYELCKKAFAGGFTHANAFYQGETIENVSSFDFTSSYPYVMLSEKFPMEQPVRRKIETMKDIKYYTERFCCLFELELYDVEPIVSFENYISESKCWEVKGAITNNGRIAYAEHLKICITEQDYFIITACYKWREMHIGRFLTFRREYLPADFVKSILHLYKQKTTLKGVEGKEAEYLRSKEDINSCFGMCVTDICRADIDYSLIGWAKTVPDVEEAIAKSNKSKNRFLYYPWGVWVTAYARRNLWLGIMEFKNDYIYSDTDSIKAINAEKHMAFINSYNKQVVQKLQKAANVNGFDISETCPLTIQGKPKQLGVWDYEGKYSRFKTLGAKRYMVEEDGKINITVAGVNKRAAVPYLVDTYGDRIFEAFNTELYIPKGKAGKNMLTYIDDERKGYVTDYLGNSAPYDELSCIHMEAADYSFSISAEYAQFLLGIKEEVID